MRKDINNLSRDMYVIHIDNASGKKNRIRKKLTYISRYFYELINGVLQILNIKINESKKEKMGFEN